MDAPQGEPFSASAAREFQSPPTDLSGHQRLWSPWRMRYVGGQVAEEGCLFCNRLAASEDVRSLILHRGQRVFLIMNLFPYNTGHLMIVPFEHVSSPEEAEPAALAEMATLLPGTIRALHRVLACDGFNIGINVGTVAGAGIADHLHQHIVPRWEGDANFMPILASTMVLPELIPVTYAKTRAELVRELGAVAGDGGAPTVTCVVLTPDLRQVLVLGDGEQWRMPTAAARPSEAVWRAAVRAVDELVPDGAELVGWAGPTATGSAAIGLAFRAGGASPELRPPPGARARSIPAEAADQRAVPDSQAVRWALARVDPGVAGS
jgi:ATP adenylyltransferase